MVQIPTARDVSGNSARSGRIANAAPSVSVASAMGNVGKALTQVAYDLNDLRTQENVDQRNKSGYDLQTKIAKFRDAEEQSFLKSRDETSESGIGFTRQFIEGYQKRADDFIKSNFTGISEGQDAQSRQTLLGLGNSLYEKANSYERQAKTNFYDRTTNQGLDTFRMQIRNNAAPFEDLKTQGLAAIDAADMPEPWKAERRAMWEADAAESKWDWKFKQEPQAAIQQMRGETGGSRVDKIIGVESGGNATAKNPKSSATGGGQFISSTWMDMVKRRRPDLLEGRSTSEVLALRNDMNLSREMTGYLADENSAFLRNQGLQDTDGNVYLAHFLGPRGAAQVLKADPGTPIASIVGQDAVNANPFLRGKTASDVISWSDKKMGGAGVKSSGGVSSDADFDAIPYERRQQLADQGETQYKKLLNEQAAMTRFQIETATQNAPAAIQNTGGYSGQLPTPEQFTQAYGANEGAQRYSQLMAAVETSQQAYKMQTMPVDEITGLVDAAKPTSSGDTAALDNARYETLSKAAASTLKAREADPSTYVQQAFPKVSEAWETAQADGDYQTAMSVTAAAQKQLGIQNMQLLPKELADQSVAKFKDATLPEQDRIGAATGLIFATKDPEQQRAVFNQLVDAGLPDTTEGAIDAFARGDQGAGRRLMEAAIIDPSKLPGQSPFKPAEIDTEIQAKIMDDGQIGDIFYGLSDGTIENQERAMRDSKLLTNAVTIRVRNGETLEAAVDAAAKDLYGDVVPVSGDGRVGAQIILPADADPEPVLNGLSGLLPKVEETMKTALKASGNVATGEAAVISGVTENYIANVMAQGYFRNAADGYVFIDPFVGAAVAGPDGMPLVFTEEDVAAGGKDTKALRERYWPQDEPLTDDAFTNFQKKMGAQ